MDRKDNINSLIMGGHMLNVVVSNENGEPMNAPDAFRGLATAIASFSATSKLPFASALDIFGQAMRTAYKQKEKEQGVKLVTQ